MTQLFLYVYFVKSRLRYIFISGFLTAVFLSLFLVIFHSYNLDQLYRQKIVGQMRLLQDIVESAEKQLNFLKSRLENESLSNFPTIARKLPALPYGVLGDAILLERAFKYSRRGKTNAIKSDVQYVFDGARDDSYGNLVFARKIRNRSFAIRISKRSLVEALGADSLHISKAKGEYSIAVLNDSWLTFEPQKKHFGRVFGIDIGCL